MELDLADSSWPLVSRTLNWKCFQWARCSRGWGSWVEGWSHLGSKAVMWAPWHHLSLLYTSLRRAQRSVCDALFLVPVLATQSSWGCSGQSPETQSSKLHPVPSSQSWLLSRSSFWESNRIPIWKSAVSNPTTLFFISLACVCTHVSIWSCGLKFFTVFIAKSRLSWLMR